MAESPAETASLDVVHPSGERTRIPIDPLPFRIGRGADCDLILRDSRASRAHARIFREDGVYAIEDLKSLHGTWVNGSRVSKIQLRSGDAIHFGFDDSYQLMFSGAGERIARMLDQLTSAATQPSGPAGNLTRLRTLVDVARSLQTTLATGEILNAVIDAALSLIGAQRGFLLLFAGDTLEVRIGRDDRGRTLRDSDIEVPTSLIQNALRQRRDLLSMTLQPHDSTHRDNPAAGAEQRSIVCVPLVRFRSTSAEETMSVSTQTNTVGLLYLESKQSQPLTEANRELLRTLALEASTVLENARHLEEERQRDLLEKELGLAREIQRSLLPQSFPKSGWLAAAGSTLPSADVAGDYFDLHHIDEDHWATIIADVSGKGLSSALLASVLQGAFLLGSRLSASPEILVSKINDFLLERAHREKYATLFYATLSRSGRLSWVNAGHCEPILVRSGGEIRRLSSTGPPLGLLTSPKYNCDRMDLLRGDKVVAFSDGLTEAENSSKQAFEGSLEGLLRRSHANTAQQLHDILTNEVKRFSDAELTDDVTLLVLEYRGESGALHAS